MSGIQGITVKLQTSIGTHYKAICSSRLVYGKYAGIDQGYRLLHVFKSGILQTFLGKLTLQCL
jgi:hypothetical protein